MTTRLVRAMLAGLLLMLTTSMSSSPPAAALFDEPAPPEQPMAGPGGLVYDYDRVVASRFGDRPTGYWLFQPALGSEARPPAKPVPLVIFLHGFTAVDPGIYGGWIDHLVRRGNVVIYPDYQTLNPFTLRPDEYLDNAFSAVRDALVELQQPGAAPVDLTKVAVTGHSVGGVLTSNYAALAEGAGLPVPNAIMPVEPGGCEGCGGGPDDFAVSYVDLSLVDPATKLVMVVGDRDTAVGDAGAKLAWEGMSQIPAENRDYMIIRSDDHGRPDLDADHFMPQTGSLGGESDALDWFGLWKTFDLLTACAFDGDCDGMNGSPEQLDMGQWSDGTPVLQPIVTDSP